MQADALEYLPVEPVDVVICEMLHTALLREKQLTVIHSFIQRYRAKFGERLPEFIPTATRLLMQPVEQSFVFAGYHAPLTMFQPANPENSRTTPLAEPLVYSTICYDESVPLNFSFRSDVPIEHIGRCNALRFFTQNFLAIDVPQQRSITWPNQFLVVPIATPLPVTPGQSLNIGFHYSAGQPLTALQQSISCQLTPSQWQRKCG